ncbi:MAG: sterol desaturase family protein [Stappiaceae bacterium]
MLDTLDLRFSAFGDILGILEIVGLVFLVLILSETTWDFLSGKRRRYHETLANFFIAFGYFLLERTVYGLVFVIGLLVGEQFALFSIPITWWSWILAVLVADFTYYWMHRMEHEIRLFWAHHSVHHSSPEFNLTTSLRLAWVEGLVEWIFLLPMILIGFDAVQTLIAFLIVVSYQTWIHTEKIGKLGWLDKILNTPSVHRVHHGSNEKYIDKNYGGVLIIWDRLFGTYQEEEEKVVYGVTEPINTSNPIRINFYEYGQIIRDIRRARTLREVMGFLFNRPGWKPDK